MYTINLTIEIITSVLYKISLTLFQSLKSHSFFLNKSMVIGHSISMCLTDRIFLQICKPPYSIHTTLRASQLEHENETKKSDAHRTKSGSLLLVTRLAEFVPLLHSTHITMMESINVCSSLHDNIMYRKACLAQEIGTH